MGLFVMPGCLILLSRMRRSLRPATKRRLAELVAWNVRIKAAVVQEDPFERGVRAALNLGHTFGHAIENVMEYAGVQHGEAVALGMVAAARLAERLGKFPGGGGGAGGGAGLRKWGCRRRWRGWMRIGRMRRCLRTRRCRRGSCGWCCRRRSGRRRWRAGFLPEEIQWAVRSLTGRA